MENIFENLPDLYTNRIRLRKINQNDLEQLFSFLSNDNVTRYMIIDKIQDIKVVEKMINFMIDGYKNNGPTPWAMKVVVDYAFNYMNLNKIEARCISKNVASENVMLKANMKLDAILREEKLHKQSYVDLKLYSILKEEYVASDLYKYKIYFK